MTKINSENLPRLQRLERVLMDLHLYSGPVDDDWGQGVDRGLEELYRRAGWREPGPAATPAVAATSTFPNLPPAYAWLRSIGTLPKPVEAAIPLIGVLEGAGGTNSPAIMLWKQRLNQAQLGIDLTVFTADAVPWCGLFMAYVQFLAGYGKSIPKLPLAARSWIGFGSRIGQPGLGDVLVFSRKGGNHVALYIGEDRAGYYHVLGGNQSNSVSIKRIAKDRCIAVRRAPYASPPPSVRPFVLAPTGAVSHNEA